MFWWWFMPQIHWPFSGDVAQDIETSWLLGRARDAKVEKRVLGDVASYGRQIGVLTDVVLALADHSGRSGWSEQEAEEHAKLRQFAVDIAAIKSEVTQEERGRLVASLTASEAELLVNAIRQRFPAAGRKS